MRKAHATRSRKTSQRQASRNKHLALRADRESLERRLERERLAPKSWYGVLPISPMAMGSGLTLAARSEMQAGFKLRDVFNARLGQPYRGEA